MNNHTVRVNCLTLEKLRSYKDKCSLSYNEIINLALENLNVSKYQNVAMEAPIYKIRVNLKRVKINKNFISLLKKGYDIFISDITYRQAIYLRRKLIHKGISCCINKSQTEGDVGYIFISALAKS